MRMLIYGMAIGAAVGLGSAAFFLLLHLSQRLFLGELAGYWPPVPAGEAWGTAHPPHVPSQRMALLLLPALGGFLSGLLAQRWAPETAGDGTDAVIDAFHRGRGLVRFRVVLLKMLTSALTIGSGGSAGREGPITQIGGGVGSALARLGRLSDRDRRTLLLAGAGAGLGSIFRAPLGGALFAAEMAYRDSDFEVEAVMPAIIGSIVGYCVYNSLFGWGPLFSTPPRLGFHPLELLPYGALGVSCALLGAGYIWIFRRVTEAFRRGRLGELGLPWRCALGGAAVGAMALLLPQLLGMGYGWVQLALYGKLSAGTMLLLAPAKCLATSLTIGSGGSGGVFAPTCAIGAMLGGGLGGVFHRLFPHVVAHPEAFVLVGMGGLLAAVAHTPIASVIMVCEMTEGYGLLVPLMLVAAIGHLLLGPHGIYERQVLTRAHSPAHRGDYLVEVLTGMRVAEVFRWREVVVIPEGTPLRRLLALVSGTDQHVFPVVDGAGRLVGIISLDDIRRVLLEEAAYELIIARDLARPLAHPLTPQDSLEEALQRLTTLDLEEIPVVSREDPSRVVGMLSRRDLLLAYGQEVERRHQA